ncbi:GroES-like protein [Xylariomycetidae sp. FL2044]|nr:GroES-like protein [Xylariomycetidae sp. FL2044]
MPLITVFKGSQDGLPKKHTMERPDQLTGDDVLIRITASGVCGTDLHYLKRDMVLGHEGVGIVEATGPACQHLQQGDRVGWGFCTNSCGHCRDCLESGEQYCADRELYGQANPDRGSFASHAVYREAFLHAIPESLSDVDAAPLQCGGATTFSALNGVRPGDVVGVMGIGGLGHLAIQFAAKMGCRVMVLSGSEGKREEAMRLGAHDFITTRGGGGLAHIQDKVPRGLDRLLVTTSGQPDWKRILPIMAPRSGIYTVAVGEGDLDKVPYMPLIMGGISIRGSLVASRAEHRRMLDFAALHGVRPVAETFPMTEDGAGRAVEKLRKGEVKYRAVLVAE